MTSYRRLTTAPIEPLVSKEFNLYVSFQGNDGSASRYETNVNVCPVEETDKDDDVHVSTMTVKGASPARINVEEDVQPEDLEFVNHQTQLMEGMNALRLNGHLLDVKLWAEGQCFKVSHCYSMGPPIRCCCQRPETFPSV